MPSARMKRKLLNQAPVTVTVVHGHVRQNGKRQGPGSTLQLVTWMAERLVKKGLVRFGATADLSQGGDVIPPATETAPKKTVVQKTATKKAATKKKPTKKRPTRKRTTAKKTAAKTATKTNVKVTG
ncbi:MAG: hypothetical protein ABF335_03150 [Alphaproteobacteria bacterium]